MWIVVGSCSLLAVLGASGVVLHSRGAPAPLLASVTAATRSALPTGVRIRVQVLNTTKTRGLARRATQLLRDRGFDVVEMGTVGPHDGHHARARPVGTSRVGGRRREGHGAGAHRARARDSSRYLDVTVLVGSSWRPPAEPLYP